MTKHISRSLFGGALLAAGLSASTHADSPQFLIAEAYIRTFAGEYASYTYQANYLNTLSGPFFVQSSAAYGGASAVATFEASSSLIRASASAVNGFAESYDSYLKFTVDQDVTSTVAWDFSGGTGLMLLIDLSNGDYLASAGGSSSGSLLIPLHAGTDYWAYHIDTMVQGTGECFWSVTVPSPAAAGPLVLAGLAASRKRRR